MPDHQLRRLSDPPWLLWVQQELDKRGSLVKWHALALQLFARCRLPTTVTSPRGPGLWLPHSSLLLFRA